MFFVFFKLLLLLFICAASARRHLNKSPRPISFDGILFRLNTSNLNVVSNADSLWQFIM